MVGADLHVHSSGKMVNMDVLASNSQPDWAMIGTVASPVASIIATLVAIVLAVCAIRATRTDDAKARRQRLIDALLPIAPRLMTVRHTDPDAEVEWKALRYLFETEDNGRDMFEFAWSIAEFGRWVAEGSSVDDIRNADLPHPDLIGRHRLEPIIEVGKDWAAEPSTIRKKWGSRVDAFLPFTEDRKRGEYVADSVEWQDGYRALWQKQQDDKAAGAD